MLNTLVFPEMHDSRFPSGSLVFRTKLNNRRIIVAIGTETVILKLKALHKDVDPYFLQVGTVFSQLNKRGIATTYLKLSRDSYYAMVSIGLQYESIRLDTLC